MSRITVPHIARSGGGGKVSISPPPYMFSGYGIAIPLSGAVQSGYSPPVNFVYSGTTLTFSDSGPYCAKCKCIVNGCGIRLYGMDVQYKNSHFCFNCAGYTPEQGFKRREDWIMEELGVSDIPLGILADLCEENYRKADADYLRNLTKRQ